MIRWTPRLKARILGNLAAGRTTRAALLQMHGISSEELAEWRRAYNKYGIKGLRTTRTQERRPPSNLRSKKHTPIIQ